MRILITGAAGFIGSQLCSALLKLGHSVWAVDNLNSYYDPQLKHARIQICNACAEQYKAHFRFVELDLCNRAELDSLFEEGQFEQVYHLAAQAGVRYSLKNPLQYVHSNLEAFVQLLECCQKQKVQHFIFASSSSTYGMNNSIPFTETEGCNHPVSLYAATKRSNELIAHAYAHLYKIPSTGLRFFTVYGPWGRPDMAYYSFTHKIFSGETIQVFNHGKMQRDFTFISDVVEPLVRLLKYRPKAIENPQNLPDRSAIAPFRIFNIGNSQPVSLMDFILLLEKTIGKKADLRMVEMQAGDVLQTYANVNALHEAVNYIPSTSLEAGLAKFVQWYREYHSV